MPASNYPSLAIAAGTQIHVANAYPDTHDTAGFTALSTTLIGLLATSNFPKVDRAIEEKDLMSGFKYKYPGLKNMAPIETRVVFQSDDAGQLIVQAASDTETHLSFVWHVTGGMKIGCVGYVTGYSPTVDAPNSTVDAMFTIHPVFDSAQVGVVRWTV